MSNITGGGSGSFSSGNTNVIVNGGLEEEEEEDDQLLFNSITTTDHYPAPLVKKKRNLPGNPDPKAEVIALSPRALLATNRFICEVCNKGFQRDQNLQLHRRGHNLPWKLKQRNVGVEVKKRVYVCPEPSCVHHNPTRALGDLTGIKKHFCRKHGEKKWKCEKCSKKYAVQSDWKAHGKTCGTKEYKCDCGTIFSRRDSFITHRAFCDALAEENNKPMISSNPSQATITMNSSQPQPNNNDSNKDTMIDHFTPLETKINPFTMTSLPRPTPFSSPPTNYNITPTTTTTPAPSLFSSSSSSATSSPPSLHLTSPLFDRNASSAAAASMSATALLQKAAQMGSTLSSIRPAVHTANVAPKQSPFGSDQHGFMDQFFHVAGGIFNASLSTCPSGFFVDVDNHNNHNNNNNAAALLKNFGGGDAMTTVDFLGVNNNHGGTTPLPSSTSALTRIMVPRFSPPL